MEENGLENPKQVNHEHLRNELIRGLGHFRLKPAETYEGVEQVKFNYMTYDFISSNETFQSGKKTDRGTLPDQGIFLCPNIVTSYQGAGQAWTGTTSLIDKLNGGKDKNENLTMSVFAASAKFNNGKKVRAHQKPY